MERLEYNRYGAPELVHLAAFTLPGPQVNEVLVCVAAAAINPLDWKICNGDTKLSTGSTLPEATGTDFTGTVEAVGSKISDPWPGDTAVGTVSMKGSGAFAPSRGGRTARCGRDRMVRAGQACWPRVGPRSVAQAQSMGLSLALDYTMPLPATLDGSLDVVFDANGSLSIQTGDRLIKRGGKRFDLAPTKWKFLKALLSRSREADLVKVDANSLHAVVDIALAGKFAIPVVQTVFLAPAPALLASSDQEQTLQRKSRYCLS